MSELDNDAWPQDPTLPQGDGPALDDQAALAFEIAAMRVRASWDELDTPAETAPTGLGAPPVDPFAPISAPAQVAAPGNWSAPPASAPPASFAPQAPAALAPAATLPFASAVSPSSVVDTAPLAFLLATPAAIAGGPKPQTTPFEDPTPAPTFLPSNKLASPKTIAIAAASVVVVFALWLMGGDDAPAAGVQGSTPNALSTPAPRVEAIPAVPSPGTVAAATPGEPRQEQRLAVVTPTPTGALPAHAQRPLGAVSAPASIPTPSRAEAPSSKEVESSAHHETKSSDSRRSKRSPSSPSAQSRAQRHESVASAKPTPKRKSGTESPRPSASSDSSKRKGTGFVSANPY